MVRLLRSRIRQAFPTPVQTGVALARRTTSQDDSTHLAALKERPEVCTPNGLHSINVNQIGHGGQGSGTSLRVALSTDCIYAHAQSQQCQAQATHSCPKIQHQPRASDWVAPWELGKVTPAAPSDWLGACQALCQRGGVGCRRHAHSDPSHRLRRRSWRRVVPGRVAHGCWGELSLFHGMGQAGMRALAGFP